MKKTIVWISMCLLLAMVFLPPNVHAEITPDVRITPMPDTLSKGGFVGLRVEIAPGAAVGDMHNVRLVMLFSGEAVATWDLIESGKKVDQLVTDIYIGDAQIGMPIAMTLYYTNNQGEEKTADTGFTILKGLGEASREAKIVFTRTSTPAFVQGAELADITYTVRNEGVITVLDLIVVDDLLGHIGTLSALVPGAEEVFIAQVVPGEDVISQPRLTYTNALTHQVFTNALEPLAVVVAQPKLAVLLKADQTAIRAGDAVTFTYTVLNEGNVTFYDVQLSDEHEGLLPGTDKLEPGESYVYNKTEKLVMPAEYSFVAAARDEFGKDYSVSSNAVAVQVTDTSTLAADAGVLTITASTDIALLKEPGKVRFVITVKNSSPDPVVELAVSEANVGVFERMEKLPTGDKIFYYETEVTAASQFAFTAEGRLGDASGPRVQATTQTLTVDFQGSQPVTPNPWDNTITPQPTTMESEQTGTQALPPAKQGTNWLLVALAVVGTLILLCVLLLIRAFLAERRKAFVAADYEVYAPGPVPLPVEPIAPEPEPGRPITLQEEPTRPQNAPPRAQEDVPTRPEDKKFDAPKEE